jgi:hypothetical protein
MDNIEHISQLPDMPYAADNGDLRRDLAEVINRHSRENGSNTPDYVLAQYLCQCLDAFDMAVNLRAAFYGRADGVHGSRDLQKTAGG